MGVNSSFNYTAGVHFVVKASLHGLASLVISKATRKRKLEPDSLVIFDNEERRRGSYM